MKKYLRITIVLVVFLTVVLLHDLNGGSRKLAAAAGSSASNPSYISTPVAVQTPLVSVPMPEASSTPALAVTPASMPTPTPTPMATSTSMPTPAAAMPTATPAPSPTPTPQWVGLYKDGSYTGSPADAYYGSIQVQAVVAGGRLIDVKFLQYPNHTRTSQRINQQVMPWLTQEAVQAQSAHINVISGASATSYAFAQSLTSALAKAK
jgi:uncharacterized protein with FMN-binding domain